MDRNVIKALMLVLIIGFFFGFITCFSCYVAWENPTIDWSENYAKESK